MIPSAANPRHRMTSDQRRKAIVDAAVQLFAQNGFRGTTTRQIAHAVGVSEPVLYMHFQTKRDLYNAIIENMAHKAESLCSGLLSGKATDEEVFQALATEVLAWHVNDPTRIRLLLFSALEGHELSDLFYQGHIVPFLQMLASHIERRISEGAFRPVDPAIAARAFCGMIGQFGQGITVFKAPHDEEARKMIIQEMVGIFLNGMKQPEVSNR